jgi:phenylacetate-CoA ligase
MSVIETPPATSWIEEASARFVAIMPEHIQRLSWDTQQLRAHQDHALAHLVRTAAAWSPFHRRRLAGIDLDSMRVDRLVELPVMSKADMMAELDDVFTDRRLTRGLIDRHLAGLGEEADLLLDEYAVLASGGSSGTRGVFVITRDQIADFTAYVLRAGMAQLSATAGWPPPAKIAVALVMAPSAIHATRSMTPALSSIATLTYAPVTLPLDEIIDRLNRCRPAVLIAYPSVLARLGDAAASGRLHIEPKMMLTTAEQLLADQVQRIVAGFGMPPGNSFGSTEGLVGTAPPGSAEFTFASDRAIIEFVDADEHPVPAGTPAHHVLITNLISHAQPLIRYRMDDTMTELPSSSDHGHQRATIDGRNDELLVIGDVTVHPLAIRSALLRHQTITQYQIRVTSAREPATMPHVHLALVTSGPISLHRAEQDIATALDVAGATAHVTATTVDELERNPATGKIRRFMTPETR